MIAAVYARKSTEQTGIDEDAKSVTRQIEHAKAYAARKGWQILEEHVFVDDGISGAEFAKRPGLMRLLGALKPAPPFQVLIVSEESRLGRESIETAYVIKQLVVAGVRLFFYLEERERTLDTPLDKIMLQLTSFADEMERERSRSRTYDAMLRKAKAGHVTGGSVFGYDNVDIAGTVPDAQGRLKRSHVELCVNDAEAEIVRTIFRRYADGQGFTTIAKALNAEGAVCPRPRPSPSKPKGWVSSSVRQVLLRRLYVGEQVWGKTKKRTPWGIKKAQRRAEQDWLIIPVPQLRIVPVELWEEVQKRWAHLRKLYLRATDGRLHGRPTNGLESPYLLTGFTECKTCKGSLFVRSRSHGKQRAFHYACTTHYNRGPEACAEPMLLPMALLDRAVLQILEQEVLHPAVVVRAIEKALQQLQHPAEDTDARRETVRKEVACVEAELAQLATAIATGGPLPTLLSAMQSREDRRTRLQAELATLEGLTAEPVNLKTIEHELHTYLGDWLSLAPQHPAQTRQILRKLLPNRIRVWREVHGEEKRYHFEGEAAVGRFFKELVKVKRSGVPNGEAQSGHTRPHVPHLPGRAGRMRVHQWHGFTHNGAQRTRIRFLATTPV